MSDEAPLERLCRHVGIGRQARDAAGQMSLVADTARRALLQAIGIPSGDPDAEDASLRALEAQQWRRILPPVAVLSQDADALRLSLTRPADWGDGPLRWMLTEEAGAASEGELSLGELAVAEQRIIDGQTWLRHLITLPRPDHLGYHRLQLSGAPARAEAVIIVAPSTGYQPQAARGEQRSWGLATQLAGVRSARNWGIGDFTDLTRLVELAGEAGAGALAPGALHALFPERPERCDPYSPSSRRFVNPLYIDVEALPELSECPAARDALERSEVQAQLRALQAAPYLELGQLAKLKLDVLERLYRHFCDRHLATGSPRAQAFQAFREDQGEALQQLALFQVLAEELSKVSEGPVPWPQWPAPYRDPASQEVAVFAAEHAARVELFSWLQWIAQQQLQAVGTRSLELRLALGLCLDLAAGPAPDGAEVWAAPSRYLTDVTVMAPLASGERLELGVSPWHPLALRECAYAPLAETLRASMREAGVLRLDHVMTLLCPFVVPHGGDPASGAHLAYPLDELLGILTLESLRNECLLVCADPSPIPSDLCAALVARGIFPERLFLGERDAEGAFLPPEAYAPATALAATTHDQPTLTGFWQGTDLEQRRTLGLFASDEEYERALVRRSRDRTHLLLALDHAGLLPVESGTDPVTVPKLTAEHLRAIYLYLARAPARLLVIQVSDLLGQSEQTVLPGSGDAYPSWRQRLPLGLESWSQETEAEGLLAAVREERGVVIAQPARPSPREGGEERRRATIPRATYRLQLQAGFGFAAAAELIPYLAALGVSHAYFSPYLQARPGSTHGYDVTAHDRLNPELGSRADFEHLCETLAAHGMGQILDMVPNHVGIMGSENRWWLDVLENGPASPHTELFDIDWQPLKEELRGKVLVPVLGDHYGNVLDSGALRLVLAEGAFHVEYYEHHFPIDPHEYPRILAPGLDRLRERLADHPDLAAFESLVTAFGNLPPRTECDGEARTERLRDKELHKQRLAELARDNADIGWYLQECLREYNGGEDYPADAGRLHALLETQAYRLAHWRVAADEINYRRFFDINDLAALRMESPAAFEATHGLVLELIASGKVQGLRIDHPDGLYDPAGYFAEIQRRAAAAGQPGPPQNGEPGSPLYLLVEKILVGDEPLPEDWPVHGTTGYEAAALTDSFLVDPAGAQPLSRCYHDFIGDARPLTEEIYAAKRLVMRNLLSSELHVLASEAARIAEADPHTRDFTLDALRQALMEIVACFPVYRTYIASFQIASRDRNQILKAVAEARRRSSAADLSVFRFVQDVLLTDIAQGKPERYRARVLRLAMKFQQYTGPVTAKGLEDTAFYRYHRLVSLNEVGGDPERFGLSIESYHRANARRLARWPHSLLAGSTHDSKRSEDVRARLHVLSEWPEAWRTHVERWGRLNRRHRRTVDGRQTWPDASTEYLFYQSLLGAWPLEELDPQALGALGERIHGYMEKAVREAKVHTAWTSTDADYEAALHGFVDAVLDPERNRAFFDDFVPFQRRVARIGLFNSLTQLLLRLTVPGVPDLYQGSELWGFHLVDPDNRRPVDFARRRALLEEITTAAATEAAATEDGRAALTAALTEHLEEDRTKLYLVWRGLALRRAYPDLLADGDYLPLEIEGPHRDRLCAFSRSHAGRRVIVLAPRHLAGLVAVDDDLPRPFADGGWDETFVMVPAADLEDWLSGGRPAVRRDAGADRLPVAEVLRRFPVGLLVSDETSSHDRL